MPNLIERLRLGNMLPATLIAVALLGVACGGSSDASSGVASLDEDQEAESPDGTDAPIDEEQALLDFTECMRDQGVDMPDPVMDENGNLQLQFPHGASARVVQKFREAADECNLEGATQGFHGGDQTEIQDALLSFARCIRDQGIEDFPDPDFSNGSDPGSFFSSIDFSDPDIQAAAEACREELSFSGGPGQ